MIRARRDYLELQHRGAIEERLLFHVRETGVKGEFGREGVQAHHRCFLWASIYLMMSWAVLYWEMKLMESCWGWRSIGLWHIIYLLYIWPTTPWELLLCSWLANRQQPIPAQHDSNHRNKVKMSFYTFELRPPSSFCFFWAWVSRILPAITAPSLLVEAFLSAILSWSLSQNSAFNP